MGIAGLMATAFVVGLSGAMGPGSLLVVVATETVRKGFWAGPAAVAGHAAVEVLMVSMLSLGLGKVLSYEKVLGVIGLAGGLMLFYFGYATLRTAKTATLSLEPAAGLLNSETKNDSQANPRRKSFMSTSIAGMAASVSNPYWIIWWATVGAAYVATSSEFGLVGPAAFFLGHIAADLAWYSLVSLAISTGARFFTDKTYRGILYVCGGFLFLFGAWFLKLGGQNIFRR